MNFTLKMCFLLKIQSKNKSVKFEWLKNRKSNKKVWMSTKNVSTKWEWKKSCSIKKTLNKKLIQTFSKLQQKREKQLGSICKIVHKRYVRHTTSHTSKSACLIVLKLMSMQKAILDLKERIEWFLGINDSVWWKFKKRKHHVDFDKEVDKKVLGIKGKFIKSDNN